MSYGDNELLSQITVMLFFISDSDRIQLRILKLVGALWIKLSTSPQKQKSHYNLSPEMGKKENILENIICILISYQQDKIPSISFSTIW